jgi:serine protease inhibitor
MNRSTPSTPSALSTVRNGAIRIACAGAIAMLAFVPRSLLAQRGPPPTTLTFRDFGAHLLAAAVNHAGRADSNTVISPLSAGLALSLASFGANGGTASALANMLGTSALSRSELEKRGSSLIAASANRKDVQLEIANAVWTDNSMTLTRTFQASARAWRARFGSLALHSTQALAAINGWADSATHGKIRSILTRPLPDTTLLFIANAVYFKGKWLTPFNTSLTQQRPFTLRSGRKISVPSMQRTGEMRYSRDSGYQMVRLPYSGDHVAMYVILPDSGDNGRIERSFAERGWPASLAAGASREIHLVLPKLHIEQETDLLPLLDQLGAGVATSCKRADFSGMAVDRTGQPPRQLCIGKALQKVYLDVDERGTEAAAVTGIGMATTTALRMTTEFVVERPFIILLRDETTGADLFAGNIRHP